MDLVSHFIRYLEVERQLSSHTVRAYGSDIAQLQAFLVELNDLSSLGENVDTWSQVQERHLLKFMRARMTVDGAASVGRKVAAIKTFFTYIPLFSH